MQGHTSEEDLTKGSFYAGSDICFHAEHKHRSGICPLLKTKASKLTMSVWKSGGVVLKFGRSSDEHLMTAVQLWSQSHPHLCSWVTSALVHQLPPLVHDAHNRSPTCWPCPDLPVDEDRFHAGTPGVTEARMIDYKSTAKQGLWPLMGASCSLLRSHEKKEDKTKGRKSEDDSAAVEASSQSLRHTPGFFCLWFTVAVVCLLITPFSTSGLHLHGAKKDEPGYYRCWT